MIDAITIIITAFLFELLGINYDSDNGMAVKYKDEIIEHSSVFEKQIVKVNDN